jgi:hypothetical protein
MIAPWYMGLPCSHAACVLSLPSAAAAAQMMPELPRYWQVCGSKHVPGRVSVAVYRHTSPPYWAANMLYPHGMCVSCCQLDLQDVHYGVDGHASCTMIAIRGGMHDCASIQACL